MGQQQSTACVSDSFTPAGIHQQIFLLHLAPVPWEIRDAAAACSNSAAEGVEAVGCAFDSAAAAGPRGGVWAAAPDGFGAPPGAKEVGADFAASAAAFTASGATGAPPTWASIGEPPGRAAAAALQGRRPD
jgi:hypothetical protein